MEKTFDNQVLTIEQCKHLDVEKYASADIREFLPGEIIGIDDTFTDAFINALNDIPVGYIKKEHIEMKGGNE
jgi:hypothetical protein